MDRKPWKNEGNHRAPFGGNDRRDGFRSDRRDFGERRSFGDRKPFGAGLRRDRPSFGGERGARFGVRSGPRARALEMRRYADRSDFAKQGVVRLDADVADYFDSAEAVNNALRLLIQSSLLLSKKAEKEVEAEDPTVATAEEEEVLTDDIFDDEEEQELDNVEEDEGEDHDDDDDDEESEEKSSEEK